MKVIPEKKKIKSKNNYSKLRSQKNSLQNRLNIANNTVCLQIDEIRWLTKELEIKQSVNNLLENKINLEVEEKRVAFDKIIEINNLKEEYYSWYMEEIEKKNKTENKLIIRITVLMFVITGLIAILIKGL